MGANPFSVVAQMTFTAILPFSSSLAKPVSRRWHHARSAEALVAELPVPSHHVYTRANSSSPASSYVGLGELCALNLPAFLSTLCSL